MKTLSLFLLVSALGMFFVGCVSLRFPVGPDEQNPVLHDVRGLIENLPTDFASVKVKGTCNPFKTKLSYNMVNDHVQGITKINDHFILAQSTGNNVRNMEKFLLVSGDSAGKCHFNFVGTTFPHCGGIQACGNILAVAAEPRYGSIVPNELNITPRGFAANAIASGKLGSKHFGTGSEVLFFDLTDSSKPVMLPAKIKRPDKYAGAAGIAYHPHHRCHYVAVYDGGEVDLYKSNGMSLKVPACEFSLVATLKMSGVSGGGVNLLVEETGKLYLVGLNRNGDGWEEMTLGEIRNPGNVPEIETVLVKRLTNSGKKNNTAAGFRWGGGIVVKNSREIDVLAAQRSLCHALKPTRVKWWTNTKWVRVHHKGAYVAKFYLGWTENGTKRGWKSGKKAVGYEKMIELPPNAQNINLNVQAMTGRLGKKAWKDVMRCEIDPRQTYEVYGTVFKPKWKAL